eukprot:GFYU01011483.1.p1 GENE.GFYU01011483.1~~GFYU01011483.1.p1  ORF type:complete len:107 (-),score=37.22 GFYU01011483.1:514-834(-)
MDRLRELQNRYGLKPESPGDAKADTAVSSAAATPDPTDATSPSGVDTESYRNRLKDLQSKYGITPSNSHTEDEINAHVNATSPASASALRARLVAATSSENLTDGQ